MAAPHLYLGLDVGTQSTKGVLLDATLPAQHAVVARSGVPYDLITGLGPGAAEQHPHTWRDAAVIVLGELLKGRDLSSLAGIGISGQQHGLVVLDEFDQVIRPAKLWCDTTTQAEAEVITERSGRSVPTGFTLPKLLWMKNHEPENFLRVRSVLLPHDYLNFLLTGKKFMEAGDASGSGAFDPKSRTIDRELLAWVDAKAPEFFPDLVAPDEPAGVVSAAGATLFGLPQGLPVGPGGGDNMMSAIGSGATQEGATVVSLGTSGTVFSYASRPVVDPAGEIAAFCDSTGAWMPLLCTMNVTGVAEEVCRATGLSHEELTVLAAEVEPGCAGLLFLPYLAGERVPNLPNATGTLLGLRPGLLSPGHLYRAAIEGSSLGLASGIERMKGLGLSLSSVSVVGGASKNPLWRQILADLLGVPVSRLLEPEAAALGAALQALWVTRRAGGEMVTVAQVADPFIQKQLDVALPSASHQVTYRELLLRFQEETKRLYP